MKMVTFAPSIDVKDQMHLFARTLTHLSSPVFLGGRGAVTGHKAVL